jgi:hypothetical protein
MSISSAVSSRLPGIAVINENRFLSMLMMLLSMTKPQSMMKHTFLMPSSLAFAIMNSKYTLSGMLPL